MHGLLIAAGLVWLLVALVGAVRGGVRAVGLSSTAASVKAAVAALVVVAAGGALAPDPRAVGDEAARDKPRRSASAALASPGPSPLVPSSSSAPSPTAAAGSPATTPSPAAAAAPAVEPVATASASEPLLAMAAGGDGDSWRDTNGVEYRLGLVNAPETDECGGAAATAYRKRVLAQGFRAQVYATDRYGRSVSVVLAPDGTGLNVAMARDGLVDDRYLQRFRDENPRLAAQLDAAFAEARAQRRGIWRTCTGRTAAPPAPAQPAAQGTCHPDYETCIPVVGDGSGRGAANDLDCGEIGHPVRLREVGVDPYRLDGSDRDGVGCE